MKFLVLLKKSVFIGCIGCSQCFIKWEGSLRQAPLLCYGNNCFLYVISLRYLYFLIIDELLPFFCYRAVYICIIGMGNYQTRISTYK